MRSSANYPSLVAAELGLALVDVSCSGADTLALVGSQQTGSGPVPPQFLAITPETEVVTMRIGGNDEGLFRSLVETCLGVAAEDRAGSPCRDAMTAGGTDQALEKIDTIATRLTSALAGILDRAPGAEVVLVGYPQLVPERGTCDILPLAAGDYAYVRELTVALGAATAKAAADAGRRVRRRARGQRGPRRVRRTGRVGQRHRQRRRPAGGAPPPVRRGAGGRRRAGRRGARGLRRYPARCTTRPATTVSATGISRSEAAVSLVVSPVASGSLSRSTRSPREPWRHGGLAVDRRGERLGRRERLLGVPRVAVVGAAVDRRGHRQPGVER